jgi:hypothetical protein
METISLILTNYALADGQHVTPGNCVWVNWWSNGNRRKCTYIIHNDQFPELGSRYRKLLFLHSPKYLVVLTLLCIEIYHEQLSYFTYHHPDLTEEQPSPNKTVCRAVALSVMWIVVENSIELERMSMTAGDCGASKIRRHEK